MALKKIGVVSSSTIIRSNPEGTSVYIGNVKRGVTPYKHTDSRILYSKEKIRLEKEGYQPLNAVIKKNKTVNVKAVVGALFVGIPGLWAIGYPKEYFFELEPVKPQHPKSKKST